ncbi:MAG: HypC/HybG/HupF family hydrogenase formation chaperone [Actinomycetia bacterium]|nr:HypC/HybG/HupF family hydrogenase formation chaperone [Actinomycetes bacterium]
MCIAIPVRLTGITPGVMPMGTVEHAGATLACCLAYVPEAGIGDYVVIQNGFAIDVLDPESAALSLAAFAELGAVPAETPA